VKFGFVIGIVVWAAMPGLAPCAGADGPSPPQIHFAAQQKHSRPHPAVVRVAAPGSGSISFGSGTLVAVNEKHGLVLTNWHVINEATAPISVMFPDGFSSPATVLKVDRDWDLAALAIWKPNVAPVPLATRAPRAGEMLTIAGYGSGTYREATGACTQYVAPGTKFPYEMVELSAAARQGDSGGPIFNDRGEMAGVLFGEGHGRTAGSYCGRVQWFLTSISPARSQADAPTFVSIPGQQGPPGGPAAANAGPPAAAAAASDSASSQADQRLASSESAASSDSASPDTSFPPGTSRRGRPRKPAQTFAAASVREDAPGDNQTQFAPPATPADVPDLPRPEARSSAAKSQPQTVGWRDIAGDTVGQQIKTVFAGVGVLALVLHTLALMGGQRK